MKLTVVTAKQSTSLNLNGPKNRVQINTKDMSGIVVVKLMKLQNTVEKHCWEILFTTLARIIKKLFIGNSV